MGIVTQTIGTSSRNFSTAQAWEDALPANLVTDGNSYVGQMFNDSQFTIASSATFLTIAGETTDSTHTITLTTGSGQSFRDNANVQTNALRYNQSNGVGVLLGTYDFGIVTTIAFVTVSNIQISTATNSYAPFQLQGDSNIAENCIFQSLSGAVAFRIGGTGGTGANTIVRNCVFVSKDTHGIRLGNCGLLTFANCTIVKPSDASGFGTGSGIFTAAGGHYAGVNKVVNCAIFGFANVTDSSSNFGSSNNNNCTDNSSVVFSGSGNLVSKTYANQFQAVATATMDYRIKVGADLIDAGSTDTTDIPAAIDIVGTSRPQGSAWDIGAWELVVAAAQTIFVPIQASTNNLISAAARASAAILFATQPFVPFNTPQIVTVQKSGWYQQLSKPIPAAKAVPTLPTQFATPYQNTIVGIAWHRWQDPINGGVKNAKAWPTQTTQFAVPASVAPPAQTPGQFGWYAPLSRAAAVATAWSTLPTSFSTPVAAPATTPSQFGWLGPQNRAAKAIASWPTQTTQFAVPASVSPPAQTPGQFGWWANLSKPVPVAQAKPGNTFVPFNTAQVVISPQTVPLNYDAGSVQQRVVYYQSSFQVPRPPAAAPSNTITGIAWQQPLSHVVKGASANPTVPTQFATPYQNTIVGIGWHRWLDPINGGVKNATAQLTQPFVPFNTVQIVTVQKSGWYQPLSKPAPVAQAQQGNTFVPLNTRQVNSITGIGWYQNLSKPAPVAIAQAGFSFVPFNTRQVVTVQVAFDPFVKKRSKPKRDRLRDELEIKYKRRLAIEEAFWPPTTYELPPYRLPEHVKPAPDVSDLANVIMQVQQMRAAQARQQDEEDEKALLELLKREYGIEDV